MEGVVYGTVQISKVEWAGAVSPRKASGSGAACRAQLHPQNCLPFKSVCEKIKSVSDSQAGRSPSPEERFSWVRKFGDRQGAVTDDRAAGGRDPGMRRQQGEVMPRLPRPRACGGPAMASFPLRAFYPTEKTSSAWAFPLAHVQKSEHVISI